MTNEHDDDEPADLEEWAKDFRATSVDAGAPSADEIVARAQRDARRERIDWATQIGGTLLAFFVFLGLVARTRSALQAGLAAVVLPVLLGLFALFVHDRTRAGGGGDSVADHVARAVRRNHARHRLARASLAALALLATAFWIWMPFFVLSKSERFAAEPWRLAVGIVASLVVFGLGFWRSAINVRKAKAELRSWQDVQGSLVDR
jgi:hypothetical protein